MLNKLETFPNAWYDFFCCGVLWNENQISVCQVYSLWFFEFRVHFVTILVDKALSNDAVGFKVNYEWCTLSKDTLCLNFTSHLLYNIFTNG